jgi:23S rRNA pseudouridine1911/1915/1917 synthase
MNAPHRRNTHKSPLSKPPAKKLSVRAPFSILYEDNHLLVLAKPPDVPTMGVTDNRASVLSMARSYVKHRDNKPGNVYLGVVSRLDTPVSGVLLLAKTSKAASRLTEQFRERDVEKTYWAIVAGRMPKPKGKLVDYLAHDDRAQRVGVVTEKSPQAKQAVLSYRRMKSLGSATLGGATLLEVQLETGRKHQIRVQLSHAGYLILGDRKYGAKQPFPTGIALHGRRMELVHPVTHEVMEFVAPLPPSWRKFGIEEREVE